MKRKLIGLAVLVITIMAMLSMGVLAADQLVMTVSSVSDAVVGETVTLTVSLTSNPNLSTLDMTAEYDAEALELQSMAFDTSFSTGGMPAVNKDGKKMTIVFSADTNYTGSIATLTFKVLKAASSQVWVNITECLDADEQNVPLASTRAIGTVSVPGAPTVCEHDFSLTTKSADTLKTAGDCQTAAVYYKSCSKCGEVSTSETDTFTGDKDENRHTGTPGDWLTDTENTKHWKEYSCCNAKVGEAAHRSTGTNVATCQHAAICDDCGKSYGTVADHSYTAEIVKEEVLKSAATCTKAAMYYKSCTGCGAVSSSETDVFTHGAALDHDWTVWTETKAASCTEKGEETRTCKRNCGVSPETRDIDATGHGDWSDDYKIVTAATCGKDGAAEGTCGRCQQKITNIVLPATGEHSWDEGTVTKDPTTTAEGEKTYTCSACGKTKTEAIAKLAAATGTTGGKVETKTKSPKTGDEGVPAVWAGLLLVACGAAVVAVARRKKENERT